MNFKFCKIYITVQALRQILLIFVLRVGVKADSFNIRTKSSGVET